jgi:uncharacterized membrane protein
LTAIAVVVAGFDATLALGQSVRPLRTLLGIVLLCFVPGYLLVATVSPTSIPATEKDTDSLRLDRDGVERALLSVGCSLLITPLLGVGMGIGGIAYAPESVVLVFNAVVVVLLVLALFRRLQVPREDRFTVTVHRRALATVRDAIQSPSVSRIVDATLVVVVLVAAATMATALVAPIDGEHSTTLTVLGNNESGSPVAGDYPRTLNATDNETVTVAVSNDEQSDTRYTVVATLQQLEDNSTATTAERELQRVTQSVERGERWTFEHGIEETDLAGERLRVVYTLYRGDAPTDTSIESAYRSVYVWVEQSGGPE